MPEPRLTTIDIAMPPDFPVTPYEAIHSRMVTKNNTYPNSWAQYSGAWNAVAYRFLSCAYHSDAFTESVRRVGNSPPSPERCKQEQELFGFFVTGLAAIESLCYGLFAICSILNPREFPITLPSNLRVITPEKTKEKFLSVFPSEALTTALQQMLDSQDFKDWNEIRNILVHRSAPGRNFYEGGHNHGEALWIRGIQIDTNTTVSRRSWLAGTLSTLLNGADTLTNSHL